MSVVAALLPSVMVIFQVLPSLHTPSVSSHLKRLFVPVIFFIYQFYIFPCSPVCSMLLIFYLIKTPCLSYPPPLPGLISDTERLVYPKIQIKRLPLLFRSSGS